MSKQSKKFTAPNEVGIPIKEVTLVHPKPKAENTKRKVPNYQKLFEIFNDTILIRIKENEKKSVKNFSKSNLASLSIPIDKEKDTKRTSIMSGPSMICPIRKI